MKVLYVTRKFPPSVGGMEKASFELQLALKNITRVKLIAYGGKNKYLPVVYPWLFLRALVAIIWWRPTVVYLQDGVMAPMGYLLRLLTRKPMVISVHGLEVSYKNQAYQAIMKRILPRVGHIVVGSEQTKKEVLSRFPNMPISKVVYGCRDSFYLPGTMSELRAELAAELELKPAAFRKTKLLVTTGRLVERKGVAWFVGNVMPRLVEGRSDVLYLVGGKGPDEEKIRQLIDTHHLGDSVKLLGYISDHVRDLLYNTADYFVMPNIPVPGDMEGFGLVAVEAASCGTPVIASGIEGITDAVVEGETGHLLPAKDAEAYVTALSAGSKRKASFDRKQVREYALARYSWRQAAEDYMRIFEMVAKKKKPKKSA